MSSPSCVYILGTSSARPMPNRDHTSLLVETGEDLTLIDCSANPIGKILRLGLDPLRLRRILVTHAHTDHTYGFPSVIYSFRNYRPQRVEPLTVFAPREALELLQCLSDSYGFGSSRAPLKFDLEYREIPDTEGHVLVDAGGYQIQTTPVVHKEREVIAYRVDDRRKGRSMTYSADTEPCSSLTRLADGTNLFIMESTLIGELDLPGHCTGEQAGKVATLSGADQLLLIHVMAKNAKEEKALTKAAQKTFVGPATIADEMRSYNF